MPNGYDVISKEHYELTVIKYNWLGQTDEIITKDFKDEPNPRVANYVAKTINGLKLKYFLAFFVITMSAILMFYEVKVKEKNGGNQYFIRDLLLIYCKSLLSLKNLIEFNRRCLKVKSSHT